MSKRTVDEIRNEYGSICAKAGHAQYTIYTIQKDLDMYNETLKKLNIEAAKAEAEEKSNEQA